MPLHVSLTPSHWNSFGTTSSEMVRSQFIVVFSQNLFLSVAHDDSKNNSPVESTKATRILIILKIDISLDSTICINRTIGLFWCIDLLQNLSRSGFLFVTVVCSLGVLG